MPLVGTRRLALSYLRGIPFWWRLLELLLDQKFPLFIIEINFFLFGSRSSHLLVVGAGQL